MTNLRNLYCSNSWLSRVPLSPKDDSFLKDPKYPSYWVILSVFLNEDILTKEIDS